MGVVACCGARTTGPKIPSWKQVFCGGVVSVVGVDCEGSKRAPAERLTRRARPTQESESGMSEVGRNHTASGQGQQSYVCVCGHLATDHAGLCLIRCCEPGCSCPEYVRDWRVTSWPRGEQGMQTALSLDGRKGRS